MGRDGNMKSGIICDLDGTLCSNTERTTWFQRQFAAGKTFDEIDVDEWLAVFAETIPDDHANKNIKEILQMYQSQGSAILFVTARSSELFERTNAWLQNTF